MSAKLKLSHLSVISMVTLFLAPACFADAISSNTSAKITTKFTLVASTCDVKINNSVDVVLPDVSADTIISEGDTGKAAEKDFTLDFTNCFINNNLTAKLIGDTDITKTTALKIIANGSGAAASNIAIMMAKKDASNVRSDVKINDVITLGQTTWGTTGGTFSQKLSARLIPAAPAGGYIVAGAFKSSKAAFTITYN